jgi:uncharacterized membrane protein
MPGKKKRYVGCIHNEGSEHSLELRKIYEVLEDAVATKHNMLRVFDEEDDDYLYPTAWFLRIESVPKPLPVHPT